MQLLAPDDWRSAFQREGEVSTDGKGMRGKSTGDSAVPFPPYEPYLRVGTAFLIGLFRGPRRVVEGQLLLGLSWKQPLVSFSPW